MSKRGFGIMFNGREIKYDIVGECWICNSHKLDESGKLKISRNGEYTTIPRLFYQQKYGTIPKGYGLYNQCGNKRCINPDHYRVLTKSEWAKSKETKPIEYDIDDNGCHVCTSHKPGKNGKLSTMRDRKCVRLIRCIWEKEYGDIPKGYCVIQKCGNPLCVNPDHLILSKNPNSVRRKEPSYTVDENNCWIADELDNRGLPDRIVRNKRHFHPRRYYFEKLCFPVPEGYCVNSGCGNPLCINPYHAELLEKSKRVHKRIRVEIDNQTGCRNVVSHFSMPDGYPYFQVNKKKMAIHRYVYETNYGKIPDDKVVMHTCDNKKCFNPAHLKLGTQRENARDALRKGIAGCKITPDDVCHIRSSGLSYMELAETYKVTEKTIKDIINRNRWKWI